MDECLKISFRAEIEIFFGIVSNSQFVRLDFATKVSQCHGLSKGRLVIEKDGDFDLAILSVESADAAVSGAVTESFQALCKLRATVLIVAPGSLPNDGKVIDDKRPVG